VHIEATPGANKLVVMGQLLDLRNPDVPGAASGNHLEPARHVVQTVTNEFGEFREEIRTSSDLELKLLAEGEEA